MPERDVHPVVGHRVEVPVHRAPGAPGLVGPGLRPAGPKLGGGVLLGEELQPGVGGDVLRRHQVQLRKKPASHSIE